LRRRIYPGFGQELLQKQSADEMTDGKAIGFRCFVNIIGRDHAARAWHIFDDDRRVAGNMFAYVTADGTCVRVVAAPRSEADNETNGFACVKLGLRIHCSRRSAGDKDESREQEQFRKFFHTVSLCRVIGVQDV